MKGRRQAKAWLAKAHESVEGAREHIGLLAAAKGI